VTQDLEKLKEWVGRKESDVDHVTIPAVHRLAAMLDRDDPMPRAGDPLPIGWHQILFPRVVRHSQIGADGHPKRGDFLPPVPLPRRMFGGKRVVIRELLRVGDAVRRESEIQAVNLKQGRSGQMVFVTVKTEIASPRGLAVTEEQDIIYRGEPDPNAPPPPAQPPPGRPVWSRAITADPVLLFRYSALTFNGHRIHYDWRYVTGVEGYPDLIVNGGLQTLLVFELARTHASTPLTCISSRNVRPLFVNRPFTVCGEPSADNRTAKLWVADQDGAPTLIAEAEFK
jgi:3-methylfumaryl-CoA hydratase